MLFQLAVASKREREKEGWGEMGERKEEERNMHVWSFLFFPFRFLAFAFILFCIVAYGHSRLAYAS